MKQLVAVERAGLIGHCMSLVFGLAGLLLILPNPAVVAALPPFGQQVFGWSMAGGGVVYILLGAMTVAIFAYRTVGWRNWLGFMLPAVFLSLGSELLGTSTGFPFACSNGSSSEPLNHVVAPSSDGIASPILIGIFFTSKNFQPRIIAEIADQRKFLSFL